MENKLDQSNLGQNFVPSSLVRSRALPVAATGPTASDSTKAWGQALILGLQLHVRLLLSWSDLLGHRNCAAEVAPATWLWWNGINNSKLLWLTESKLWGNTNFTTTTTHHHSPPPKHHHRPGQPPTVRDTTWVTLFPSTQPSSQTLS